MSEKPKNWGKRAGLAALGALAALGVARVAEQPDTHRTEASSGVEQDARRAEFRQNLGSAATLDEVKVLYDQVSELTNPRQFDLSLVQEAQKKATDLLIARISSADMGTLMGIEDRVQDRSMSGETYDWFARGTEPDSPRQRIIRAIGERQRALQAELRS